MFIHRDQEQTPREKALEFAKELKDVCSTCNAASIRQFMREKHEQILELRTEFTGWTPASSFRPLFSNRLVSYDEGRDIIQSLWTIATPTNASQHQ